MMDCRRNFFLNVFNMTSLQSFCMIAKSVGDIKEIMCNWGRSAERSWWRSQNRITETVIEYWKNVVILSFIAFSRSFYLPLQKIDVMCDFFYMTFHSFHHLSLPETLEAYHHLFWENRAFFMLSDTDQFGRFASEPKCTAETGRGCQHCLRLKIVGDRLVPWPAIHQCWTGTLKAFRRLMSDMSSQARHSHFNSSPFKNHL